MPRQSSKGPQQRRHASPGGGPAGHRVACGALNAIWRQSHANHTCACNAPGLCGALEMWCAGRACVFSATCESASLFDRRPWYLCNTVHQFAISQLQGVDNECAHTRPHRGALQRQASALRTFRVLRHGSSDGLHWNSVMLRSAGVKVCRKRNMLSPCMAFARAGGCIPGPGGEALGVGENRLLICPCNQADCPLGLCPSYERQALRMKRTSAQHSMSPWRSLASPARVARYPYQCCDGKSPEM